ncbi:hypothetical protein Tsubulata_024348, partial [Turnera subulata]
MGGRRKWEDLEINCLVNLGWSRCYWLCLLRVKSWYRASLEPKCWEQIILSVSLPIRSPWFYMKGRLEDTHKVKNFTITKLIKSIIDRSNGNCTVFEVHWGFRELEVLPYLAEKCPALTHLSVPRMSNESISILPQLIRNWKHLEFLGIPLNPSDRHEDILIFRQTLHEIKSYLTTILRGCRELVHLELDKPNYCRGLELDEETIKLASGINTFIC